MKKTKLLLVFFFILPNLLFSQSGKLRGVVADKVSGDPLPGANIIIEDSRMGAVSDINGEYFVLAVPPGVYSIRAEYIGYRTVIISNIRINANLTSNLDFLLSSAESQIESLQLEAKRPIIQRNTANTFRTFTQADIQNLPIRGLQNILALNAGTVLQNGEFYIRGGRSGEINYMMEGATATNPFSNRSNSVIIQEAIEQIQMQTGGFTAEYGGANSAVVNTTIRTGGSKLRGTIDYRTDDFAKGGDSFLGTTSRGYHNLVATIGGPVPYLSKVRFFLSGQYNYARNRAAIFIEPFLFDPLNENLPQWSRELWNSGQRKFYAPWLVEDGLSGRWDGFKDKPLTDADGKVIPFQFERNFLPNNDTRSFTTNGTLVFDMTHSLKLRLTGSYDYTRQPQGWGNFYEAVNNYYSNKEDRNEWKTGFLNLRATHIINPSTFYEIGVNWSTNKFKNYDPRFGDQWWKYSDAREWGRAGLDTSEWQRIFYGPLNYSTIFDFTLTPPNSPNGQYGRGSYTKIEQNGFGASIDFSKQINNNLAVKIGGKFESWSGRSWSIIPRTFMNYMYGLDGEYWPLDRIQWEDNFDPATGELIWSADYIRTLNIDRNGGINYYGWDLMGENRVNDGPYGPRKPFFASAYLQTKFEFQNLIFNAGLRWEHYDYNVLRPEVPEMPVYDAANEWIDVNSLVNTKPYNYLLPRLNIAFPVSVNTVIYAQYGRYVQSRGLNNIYQSFSSLSNLIPERRSVLGVSVNYLQEPERNNHYELGIRQSLTDNLSVTATTFYKNMVDLVGAGRLYADGTVSENEGGLPAGQQFDGAYLNNNIANAKGLELTLQLRRTRRVAARVNYTLSVTRGTGSDPYSNDVVLSDAVTARFPTSLYPLDFNQIHRGSIILDYRFPKGEGGKLFEGTGLNFLFTFNSGHAYTQIEEPTRLGSATPWVAPGMRVVYDNRFSRTVEPINSSTTPRVINIDMTLEKIFYFDQFNMKFYSTVLNVLNRKNIINVYPTTGTDNDDGWLKLPLASQYTAIPGYEPFYRTINLINGYSYQWGTGNQLWGPPRQIRFGIMLEFK